MARSESHLPIALPNDLETREIRLNSLSEEKEWDFNEDVEISDEIIRELYSEESNRHEEVEKNSLRSEVLEHFSQYKRKTIRSKDSNMVVKSVVIGDHVLIEKDFDWILLSKD